MLQVSTLSQSVNIFLYSTSGQVLNKDLQRAKFEFIEIPKDAYFGTGKPYNKE